jgi:hypothetical protein
MLMKNRLGQRRDKDVAKFHLTNRNFSPQRSCYLPQKLILNHFPKSSTGRLSTTTTRSQRREETSDDKVELNGYTGIRTTMAQVNDANWVPIEGMNTQPIRGLRALTRDQVNVHYDEPRTAPGERVGGVGIVRVEGAEDNSWIVVSMNAMPAIVCGRHHQPMRLYKVNTAGVNPETAAFYKCLKPLKRPNPDGTQAQCGANLYPEYPSAQLDRELAAEPPHRPRMGKILVLNGVRLRAGF